jgi:hypothetical protein
MRRSRALFVALEAIVVLVLLPVTVNVATGGSAPPGLALLRPVAWYVVAALALIAVSLAVWRFVAESRAPLAFRYSGFHQERQRRRVLDRLTERVRGELAKLFEDIPWIEPRLAFAVGAVTPSADILATDPGDSRPEDIGHAFDLFDRSMLILGSPGAGKSTLLLELARHLLVEATDQDAPVPVLLGLARWTAVPNSDQGRWRHWGTRRDDTAYFTRWCVSEMVDHNGIPRRLAAAWLNEDDGVVLLFDGLDEMPEQQRRGFIQALRAVQAQRGPLAMALTCRTAEYSRLHPQVSAQGAVEIEPLDRAQIEDLLARHDVMLTGLREALHGDDVLWDLIDSPLLLALLAAQVRADDASVPAADRHASRSLLLERCITFALARRRFPARIPVRPATLHQWLATVARAMTRYGGLQWSRAWSTTASHTLANGILPGLVLGGACAVLGGYLLVASPTSAIVGAAVLIMAIGGLAIHTLRFDTRGTRRRASGRAVMTGWAVGLLAGGLAAAALKGLYAIPLPSSALWWIAGPFVITGAFSLIYQAIRADQEAHPEKAAESDRLQSAAAARANPRYRTRYQALSWPEGRASMFAVPATLVITSIIVLPLLVAGRVAAAVALGVAAGAVLEGGAAASRGVAGLPIAHPVALLVRALRPRIVLTVVFLSYFGTFAVVFSNWAVGRWFMSVAHHAAGASRWPFDLLGVFLGFVAGQIVAYRLFAWSRITTLVADTAARASLISEHRLPWRVRRYLAFVADSGIMRCGDGRYFFRHELLAEHCRKDKAAITSEARSV